VAGVRHAVQELTGLLRGQVSVGSASGGGAFGLPDLLAGFHQAHPGVTISLREGGSDDLLAAVRAGELDLALAGTWGPPAPGLETRPLADEALIAAVARPHRLGRRREIGLEELVHEPLICLPRGSGLRTSFDTACAARGLEPTIAFEATDPPAVLELAVRGLGVGIVPESVAAWMPDPLQALEIVRPRLRSRFELAWPPAERLSPAARALVAEARAFFAESGAQ
jgi:DNA-binding transcriptional LysR family regulator